MLVLSRKVGQQIEIGPDVTITVVKLSGGGVRIGIDAPPEMPIVRSELAEQIEARNQATGNQATGGPLRLFQCDDTEA